MNLLLHYICNVNVLLVLVLGNYNNYNTIYIYIYTGGRGQLWPNGLSVWLETRGNPRLWVRIPALAGSVHDWGETLEQATEPPTAPRAPQCWLPTAPGVCALGWVKCREHISLLSILCIVVYVTNKAHLSLICIVVCIYTK